MGSKEVCKCWSTASGEKRQKFFQKYFNKSHRENGEKKLVAGKFALGF